MSAKTCSCCGQLLPDAYADVAESAGLSKQQTALFLAIAAGKGRAVVIDTIVDRVWGHDPNGGPMNPANTIAVVAHNTNSRLATSGYHIENVWGIGYRLVTLATKAVA